MITVRTATPPATVVVAAKQHSPRHARYFLAGTPKSQVYRIVYMRHAYPGSSKNPDRPVREVTAAELAAGECGRLIRAKLSTKLGQSLLFNELPEFCRRIVLQDLETYP